MTNKQIIMTETTNKNLLPRHLSFSISVILLILSILLNHLVNFHLKVEQFPNLTLNETVTELNCNASSFK